MTSYKFAPSARTGGQQLSIRLTIMQLVWNDRNLAFLQQMKLHLKASNTTFFLTLNLLMFILDLRIIWTLLLTKSEMTGMLHFYSNWWSNNRNTTCWMTLKSILIFQIHLWERTEGWHQSDLLLSDICFQSMAFSQTWVHRKLDHSGEKFVTSQ
jgi:hypothetical protein